MLMARTRQSTPEAPRPPGGRARAARWAAALLTLSLLVWGDVARAEGSGASLSLGSQIGYAWGRTADGGRPGGPLLGVDTQLRMGRIFGLVLALRVADRAGERDFDVVVPRWRLSGQIVVVPEDRWDLYLRFGLGSLGALDLLRPGGATTSYHLGPGGQLEIAEGIALCGDLLFHLPGATPVGDYVDETDRVPIRSLVNLDNFELHLGLRFRL